MPIASSARPAILRTGLTVGLDGNGTLPSPGPIARSKERSLTAAGDYGVSTGVITVEVIVIVLNGVMSSVIVYGR